MFFLLKLTFLARGAFCFIRTFALFLALMPASAQLSAELIDAGSIAAESIIEAKCPANRVSPSAKKAANLVAVLKVIGRAQDDNGVFLYCEYHYQQNSAQWWVEYTGEQGHTLIATKQLTYKSFDTQAIAPAVNQIDYRTGELRRAEYFNDTLRFTYQKATTQEGAAQKVASENISRQPLPVVDAGFDHFVRLEWERLMARETVVFDFGSIAHLRSLSLRALRQPLSKCPFFDQAFACLHVQANNRFLRLFVGELALVYDEQRRLRIFKGAVNLQSDKAKAQKATITYAYY